MTEIFTRALGRASTLDKQARTVQVTALSGLAPAVRPAPAPDGTRTRWIEELDASGADLSAFTGAPVLLDHANRVAAAVGFIEGARAEAGQIVAAVQFDTSTEADAIMAKVDSGSVRAVSLGYRVAKFQKAGTRDGLPVYRAVEWTPIELSFTPLPVDAGATVRGLTMTTVTTVAPTDTPAHNPDAVATRAAVNALIRSIGDLAGLDRAWSDAQIDAGATADTARAAAFTAMAQRSRPPIANQAPVVQAGHSFDDPTVRRRAMADALAANLCPSLVKCEGQATQYRSYRPLDLAAELLSIRGENVSRFDREGILTRSMGAHSSSDFPLLLADAANKSLLAQYQAAAPTYRQIASRKAFTDFKSHKFLRIGDFPTYQEVSENGETKYGTLSENQETVTAKEFSTGIIIGRKALLNDDLSALSDFSTLIAVRSAAFENAQVFSLVASNGPIMSDGKALFHADHGNKAGTAAAISVASIGLAVAAMRKQTGLDGLPLNIRPRYLVVGPDKELEARQLLTATTPAQTSNVNPWVGMLELIVDSTITGNRWFVAADPVQVPSLVYGYVNGAEGPQIFTETDFDTRAIKVRSGLDFGCGAIDHRGLFLNAGA